MQNFTGYYLFTAMELSGSHQISKENVAVLGEHFGLPAETCCDDGKSPGVGWVYTPTVFDRGQTMKSRRPITRLDDMFKSLNDANSSSSFSIDLTTCEKTQYNHNRAIHRGRGAVHRPRTSMCNVHCDGNRDCSCSASTCGKPR